MSTAPPAGDKLLGSLKKNRNAYMAGGALLVVLLALRNRNKSAQSSSDAAVPAAAGYAPAPYNGTGAGTYSDGVTGDGAYPPAAGGDISALTTALNGINGQLAVLTSRPPASSALAAAAPTTSAPTVVAAPAGRVPAYSGIPTDTYRGGAGLPPGTTVQVPQGVPAPRTDTALIDTMAGALFGHGPYSSTIGDSPTYTSGGQTYSAQQVQEMYRTKFGG